MHLLKLGNQVQYFQYKNIYSNITNIQCSMHDLSRCAVSVSNFARKQKHISLSLQGTEVYEVKSLYFTQQLFVFSSIILSLLEMRIAVKIWQAGKKQQSGKKKENLWFCRYEGFRCYFFKECLIQSSFYKLILTSKACTIILQKVCFQICLIISNQSQCFKNLFRRNWKSLSVPFLHI